MSVINVEFSENSTNYIFCALVMERSVVDGYHPYPFDKGTNH